MAFVAASLSLLFGTLAPPLDAQILVSGYAGGAVRSGVPGQNVWLNSIAGLAWNPAGGVVFCDLASNTVRHVRADGTLETIAGMGGPGFAGDGGPATSALLNAPSSPRYDAAGNLYFVDYGNRRIRRIDPKRVITTVAGDGIAYTDGMASTGPALQRSLPLFTDIEVNASGSIYFLDTTYVGGAQNRIHAVTPDGQLYILANLPQGNYSSLTIDGAGNLYTIQTVGFTSAAILKIAPDGEISTVYEWTTTGKSPPQLPGTDMTADAAGNLYFLQNGGVASQNGIMRFKPADGSTTFVAGGGQPPDFGYASSPDGPALPSVLYPSQMAFDAQGNIVFADTFTPVVCCNYRTEIREVTAAGQLKTLAGANGQLVPDGTPLADVWFTDLSSLAFSRTGDLYVADHCKIYKIGADGALTTFAGAGNCAYPSPGATARNADIPPAGSIAVDSGNRVWLADGYLNLYNIAQDGTVSKVIKTPVIGGTGRIAIDAKDRVYVIGLNSLYRVLPDLTYERLSLPSSPTVDGIGVDPAGRVYVAANGNIYTINDDGSLSLAYANQAVAAGSSLAIDSRRRIWMESYGPLNVIAPEGTLVLGDVTATAPGDGGPINSAGIRPYTMLSQQSSMGFSPAGDLYFLEGNRIRRLTGIGHATAAPSINPGGVVNSLSYRGGGITPGEIVAIFGSGFGTAALTAAAPHNGFYPLGVGRIQVLFNGYPAAITAVAPNQINAIVPSPLESATTASVQVELDGELSLPAAAPVAAAAPGMASLDMSGSGQAAAINQDGSINSPGNPAARGATVSFFGAGFGSLVPQLADGTPTPRLPYGAVMISPPYPPAEGPVAVTIGGQPARVSYAGVAPFLANGVFQVNAEIPAGITPGNAAVALSVGGIAASQNLTVAVR